MSKPFGVISDSHNHNWSAFATVDADGINSRLRQILDETKRCAAEVKKAGGDTMYHGGDLFHVRGSIAPSVLVPTLDCYEEILAAGVQIVINAGNHDLESKEANRIGSAITALEGIGCTVINKPTAHYIGAGQDMFIVPWIPNIADLKDVLESVSVARRAELNLLLHAPVDGVIPGLPDHGLTDVYLASLGYRRVFCGHYHHHKDFGNGVYSIGNLTPQTWSDVNTKAGFLICTDKEVKWFKSHAPAFVEIDVSTDPDEMPLIVDGNYVRAKINSSKAADIETLRQYLMDSGAAGVTIQQVKDPASATTARAGGALLKAGATLEQSINDFIKAKSFARPTDLARVCQDILTTVRSVA